MAMVCPWWAKVGQVHAHGGRLWDRGIAVVGGGVEQEDAHYGSVRAIG